MLSKRVNFCQWILTETYEDVDVRVKIIWNYIYKKQYFFNFRKSPYHKKTRFAVLPPPSDSIEVDRELITTFEERWIDAWVPSISQSDLQIQFL